MNKKTQDLLLVIFMAILLFVLSAFCFFKKETVYSEDERRVLASRPELTADSLLFGSFMTQFEDYARDQFPFRDSFRSAKAFSALHLFHQKDNNGYYVKHGYASRLEYPVNTKMLDHAAERFQYLYNTYLEDKDVKLYFSIVPDKNCFLAEANGYPAMDYSALVSYMQEKTSYMEYIDLFPLLSLDNYYRTDTHWKQETLIPTADRLAEAMGTTLSHDYETVTVEEPFYGVYCGQSALSLKPDTIHYLTSDLLENCIVTNWDSGLPKKTSMYNQEAVLGRDPYELFLSGSSALMTIENPSGPAGRELIVFRDSFGSSLVPLLVSGYSKITLVDIRYIRSDLLDQFLSFDNQDILFLYSTLLLNNSLALK